ncbi:MAG TPA: TlpA disulfide reductase family protein [Pyrinomonadaceae bacterium]
MSFSKSAKLGGFLALLLSCISGAAAQNAAAQTTVADTGAALKPASVKQIDNVGLRKALTPSGGKPLLVNFWATWCEPCREEFPDLVKLDAEYKGKIDFITISLDDVSDINGPVTKFLSEMKAGMPAYLLASQDDDAAIAIVSKDFTGALPFTILYDATGKQAYVRQGKVNIDTVRGELAKLLGTVPAAIPAPGYR